MRILTAGESHGKMEVVIIEGFPQGVHISSSFINEELRRRMSGYGRGKRMQIENDEVEIVSGLRAGVTLGSPIAIIVYNRDQKIFPERRDNLPSLDVPRPGHADLAGALKYGEKDIRNILERASARETVTRVCAGALCKQFLSYFGIKIASFVCGVGKVFSHRRPKTVEEIIRRTANSRINAIDSEKERLMIKEIDRAFKKRDSLGGIVEVWAEGCPPGLGSCMQFDRRLDAKVASYLMSIPSVKGVEIGEGFTYARGFGSEKHDAIFYSKQRGFFRKTNSAGGIEGGISNGEPLVVRLAAKPIPTLRIPLDSVHLGTKRKAKAVVERSDVCVVAALGVIAESMLAIALTESFLDKFGEDSFTEIKRNYQAYLRHLP